MLVGNSYASALFLQILTDNRCTQAAFNERKAGNHHPPIHHLCSVIPCSFLKFSHSSPPTWNAKQHVTAVGFLVHGRREENVLRKFFISPDESGVNCGKIVKLINYVPTIKHPDYVWKHFIKHSSVYTRYWPCSHWAVGTLYGIYGARAGLSLRLSSAGRAQQQSAAEL